MLPGLCVALLFVVMIRILFFSCFSAIIDSEKNIFCLEFLFLKVSLDPRNRSMTVSFAGLYTREIKKKKDVQRPSSQNDMKTKKDEKPNLINLLLSRKSLLVDVLSISFRYVIKLLSLASIKEIQGECSLPDPMINGICYGLIENIEIRNVHLSVNFLGRNTFRGHFSIPFYRALIPSILFLFQLPYTALYEIYLDLNPGRSLNAVST